MFVFLTTKTKSLSEQLNICVYNTEYILALDLWLWRRIVIILGIVVMFLWFLASLTVTNCSLLMAANIFNHILCKFSHFSYIPDLASSATFSGPSRISIASPLSCQSFSHSSGKRLILVFTVVVKCSEQRFPWCFYPRV